MTDNVLNWGVLKKVQGIYRILNKVSGHSYVGSSNHIYSRWAGHRWALRRGTHGNQSLQAAWVEYGEHSFEWFILELVGVRSELLEREAQHMLTLHSEYNISNPNEESHRIGHAHSDETKAKISKAQKGSKRTAATKALMSRLAKLRGVPDETRKRQKEALTGRPRPLAVRMKIAASHIGVRPTEETKTKISQALTGRAGRKHTKEERVKIGLIRKGAKHTIEARLKMSESKKGKKLTPEHRAKISLAGTQRRHSEATKAKIGASRKGKQHTAEAKEKMSKARKNKEP